jgi:hypothetical protein
MRIKPVETLNYSTWIFFGDASCHGSFLNIHRPLLLLPYYLKKHPPDLIFLPFLHQNSHLDAFPPFKMPQNPFKRPVFAATAVAEAAQQRISGQHVTPFLLARVGQLTGGGALAANIALVKNNASVGGKLAAKIAENEMKKTKSRL